MNRSEFKSKILWEGGVFAALEYGLSIEDIDKDDNELIEIWKEIQLQFESINVLVEKVSDILKLDEYDEDEDEEM